MNNFSYRYFVLLIILILLAYHAITINAQSYFVDECEELKHASVGIVESIFMPDSMPPLFTLMLRGWIAIFDNWTTPRWLSVVFSLGAVIATWAFTKRLVNDHVAILAAVFLAASPLQLFYAQLIRGYAMMTFVAALCIGFGMMARKTNQKRYWWLYGITSVVGMFSHYYFITIPLSFLALTISDWDFDRIRRFVVTSVMSGIASLPILIFVTSDFTFQREIRAPRPLSPSAVAYSYMSYFTGYSIGPSQRDLQSNYHWTADTNMIAELAIVSLVGIVALGAAVPIAHRHGELKPFVFLLVIPLVVIGLLGAVTGITYNVRFVAWMVIPMSMLLGFLAMPHSRHTKTGTVILALRIGSILLLFGLANWNRVYVDRYKIEDIRSAMQWIDANATEPTIFVVSSYMGVVADYYKSKQQTVVPLPPLTHHPAEINDEATLKVCLSKINELSVNEFWLVYSRAFHSDANHLFIDTLLKNEGAIESFGMQNEYAGVVIYKGSIRKRD
jgi:uncharacterized membrane protein